MEILLTLIALIIVNYISVLSSEYFKWGILKQAKIQEPTKRRYYLKHCIGNLSQYSLMQQVKIVVPLLGVFESVVLLGGFIYFKQKGYSNMDILIKIHNELNQKKF